MRFGLQVAGLDPRSANLVLIPVRTTISGSALGLAQWLVLRRFLSNVEGWPIATAIGSLVAGPFLVLIAWPLDHLLMPPEALVYAALTGSVTGIFIALGQLTVLRAKVGSSELWLGSSLAGYGLGAASTMAMSIFLALPYELNDAMTGAIAGAITGAALILLLRKGPPQAISGPATVHQ